MSNKKKKFNNIPEVNKKIVNFEAKYPNIDTKLIKEKIKIFRKQALKIKETMEKALQQNMEENNGLSM